MCVLVFAYFRTWGGTAHGEAKHVIPRCPGVVGWSQSSERGAARFRTGWKRRRVYSERRILANFKSAARTETCRDALGPGAAAQPDRQTRCARNLCRICKRSRTFHDRRLSKAVVLGGSDCAQHDELLQTRFEQQILCRRESARTLPVARK